MDSTPSSFYLFYLVFNWSITINRGDSLKTLFGVFFRFGRKIRSHSQEAKECGVIGVN